MNNLQEQLDYNIRHAADLATFSDDYSINRRARCLANAEKLRKQIASSVECYKCETLNDTQNVYCTNCNTNL